MFSWKKFVNRILRLIICRVGNSAHFAPNYQPVWQNLSAHFAPKRLNDRRILSVSRIPECLKMRLIGCRFLNSAHFAPLACGIGKNFNAQFAPNRQSSKAHFAINGIFWQKELNFAHFALNRLLKREFGAFCAYCAVQG